MDAPWFDIDNKNENDFYNQKQDSSISSEKPLFAEVLSRTEFGTPFQEPLMGDIVMPEEKSENAESWTVSDEYVTSNDNHNFVEAVKAVRKATSEELWLCKMMLQKCGGDVDKAIEEIKKRPARQRPLMGRVMMDDET